MSRPVAILRPEPGNAATVTRVRAAGLDAIALPLFVIRALDWDAVDGAAHDALLLTSANAIRHGGAGLGSVRSLPTFAVGDATATAARGVGFVIAATGDGDAATTLTVARERGFRRLLHLAGRDRSIAATDIVAATRAVYASEPLDIAPDVLAGLADSVAVLHSVRAARRLGELLDAAAIDRASVRLAAIAPAVRDAAGDGWGGTAIARRPDDDALVVAARTLVD